MRKTREIVNKGSSFESFLEEEGILDEVDEAAVKRVIAWQEFSAPTRSSTRATSR